MLETRLPFFAEISEILPQNKDTKIIHARPSKHFYVRNKSTIFRRNLRNFTTFFSKDTKITHVRPSEHLDVWNKSTIFRRILRNVTTKQG